MSDDWGLEAIIRGRTTNLDVDSTAAVMDSWQRCVSALHDLDHELSCKPITDQVLDEPSPEPLSDVSSSLPVVLNIGFSHDINDDKKIVDNKTKDSVLNTAAHHVHGCRQAKNQGVPRRKSKHKVYTVVQQAPFPDSLVLDKWNWRKYGQKAIKGSPYPRSYYRCSSSGDCRARRQVERSCEDPNTYTITYIADHCHPYPTRRYTQAGRTLTRFSPSSAKLQEVIDATTTSVNGHGSRSPPATSNSNDLEQNMDSSVINSTGDVFPLPSGSDVEDKAPAAGFINPNPDFNLPDNLISWDEIVPVNHNLGLELQVQRACGLGMEEYYHLNSWSDDLWSFDPFLVG